MDNLIDRQAAISAICNACGKIDCDKMDKCEKLQLSPANNSEIPNSSDTISRQAAIDALRAMQTYKLFAGDDMLLIDQAGAQTELMMLPPAQPEPCEDAVSREAAIDALCANCRVDTPETCLTIQSDSKWCEEVYILQHLPSVTPKQRMGKWIDVDVMGMPAQACDQCNTFYPLAYTGGGHSFCPHCGADMREVTQ